jgi:antitoxin (DNA-binding transcriptional repressor) of toxin-antitoxin stability system
MGKSISATEAVRKFSDLLNTIKFKGGQYTIFRGGKPVAVLGPAELSSHERTLGELKGLLRKIPKLGEDAVAFEKDLKTVSRKQPAVPKGRAWA